MIRTYYFSGYELPSQSVLGPSTYIVYKIDIDDSDQLSQPVFKLFRAEVHSPHWGRTPNWVLLPEKYDYLIDRLLSCTDKNYYRCDEVGRPLYNKKIIEHIRQHYPYSIILCMNDTVASIDADYYIKTDNGSLHVTNGYTDPTDDQKVDSTQYVHTVWSFDDEHIDPSDLSKDISRIMGIVAQYEQNYVHAYRTAKCDNALELAVHKAEMRSGAAAMKMLLKNLTAMYPDVDVPRVELAPPQKFDADDAKEFIKTWLDDSDSLFRDIENRFKDILNILRDKDVTNG